MLFNAITSAHKQVCKFHKFTTINYIIYLALRGAHCIEKSKQSMGAQHIDLSE